MLFDHTYIFHDFLTAIHALLIHYILYRLSLQKLYFQCLCQLLILPAASYRNPDILSSVRNLSREILNENLLFQKLCRQFLALPAVDQLAHKIICRGRIYLQSLDLAQLPVKPFSLFPQFHKCLFIIFLILIKNLHKKFCHGINIPDGHRLLYLVEPLLILRRQNPEAQSRHPIGL